jgi:hypothetical protein
MSPRASLGAVDTEKISFPFRESNLIARRHDDLVTCLRYRILNSDTRATYSKCVFIMSVLKSTEEIFLTTLFTREFVKSINSLANVRGNRHIGFPLLYFEIESSTTNFLST